MSLPLGYSIFLYFLPLKSLAKICSLYKYISIKGGRHIIVLKNKNEIRIFCKKTKLAVLSKVVNNFFIKQKHQKTTVNYSNVCRFLIYIWLVIKIHICTCIQYVCYKQ